MDDDVDASEDDVMVLERLDMEGVRRNQLDGLAREEEREAGSISTIRQERGIEVSLDSQKGTKRATWRAESGEAPGRLSMLTRNFLGGEGESRQ